MDSASNTALYKAQDLWDHIFGDERGLLAICHARAGEDFQTTFFNYPGSADTAAEFAREKAGLGRDVWFCTHLLTASRRVKENAAAVYALWGDLDGARVPKDTLAPTAVVRSSPGKFHCYWRLVDAIPPESAEQLNKRLASVIGADQSGFDLTQLLRVPGTVNRKYPERPVVEVTTLELARTYTAGELEKILPEPENSVFDEAATIEEIHDGTRNKDLTSIAGSLRHRGLDESAIYAALCGINTTKCKPPLPESEVRQIAHSIARYEPRKLYPINGSRSRSRIDQDREDRDQGEGVKNPKRSLRAVSFAGAPKPPPRQFVVEGIIPAGVPTIVYGPSGIAKSFNILHLALSVAFVGVETWHGRRIKTCPTIYLDFEMDRIEQLRRAQEVARGTGWPDVPKNFWYVNALGHSAAEVFDFAVEQLEELEEALVVVDSFGFALAGESERSADVLAFMREHIGVLQMAGGHPIIVDHVARLMRGERAGSQDAFGSIYKKNAARSNIHVTGHQEEGASHIYTTFTHKNTNVGPIAPPFTVITRFAQDEVSFELSDEVVRPPAPESTADLIVAAIEEHGSMTNKEIADTIDRPYKTVQNVTKELKDSGVLATTEEKRDGAPVLGLGGVE